jgi:protein O-GlcNAc transferase
MEDNRFLEAARQNSHASGRYCWHDRVDIVAMKPKHHPVARNGSRFVPPPQKSAARAAANKCFAEGNALLAQGRAADSIQKYVEALRLLPDYPEALCNMGSALSRLGRPGSAQASIDCYQRAISIAPKYALAHNNLGAALANDGRLAEAIAYYGRATELSPGYIDARCNLAGALLRLGRTSDAIAEYERVLERDPDNETARTALLNLADLLQIEGRTAVADAICSGVARRRPLDSEAQVRLALMQPVILESAESIAEIRARITASLPRLVQQGIRFDDPFSQYGKTNFYLAYHGLNDREIQKSIAEFHLAACPRLGRAAPHVGQPHTERHGRLRLGIICEYLDGHTVGKLYRGMIQAFARDRFETVLMRVRREADAATKDFDRFADHIVEFPRSLDAAREAIAAQRCDVIFYPEIGMDEFTYYLAFARLAPVQCVSWGHPVTTGIPSIDYFISARALEPPGASDDYSEQLIRLANPPTCYRVPPRPTAPLERERLGFAREAKLYLCPQSLFKFHPDFDASLAAILRRDRHARILLIRGREAQWEKLLMARLARSFGDVSDRVVFLAPFNQHDFFRLLLTADVMLDPFHFGGGNSTYEALAMGTPIVTLPGGYMRGRVTFACYERMGLRDLIATDTASYVELATRVANDRAWKSRLSAEIANRCSVLYDDLDAVMELQEFFEVAAAAGDGARVAEWPPR